MKPNPFIRVSDGLVASLTTGIMTLLTETRGYVAGIDDPSTGHEILRTTRWKAIVPARFTWPRPDGSRYRLLFATGPDVTLNDAAGTPTRVDFALAVHMDGDAANPSEIDGVTVTGRRPILIVLGFHVALLDMLVVGDERAADRVGAQVFRVMSHELTHAMDPALKRGPGMAGFTLTEFMDQKPEWSPRREGDPEVVHGALTFPPRDPTGPYFTSDTEYRAFARGLADAVMMRIERRAAEGRAPEPLQVSVDRAVRNRGDRITRMWWLHCTPAQRQRFLRDIAALARA